MFSKTHITFLLCFLPLLVNAQLHFSLKKHDFGELDAASNRVVDVKLTNKSDKKIFILRIDAEGLVRYLYSNRTIAPDSTEILRLKINPVSEGKFKNEVWVFTSDSNEPTIIKLLGEVLEVPRGGDVACPDFSGSTSVEQQMSFDFKIKVIDEHTEKPIHKSEVTIISNGRPAFSWKTNKQGLIEKTFPLGYYYFVTKAENYYAKEFDAFVNRRNNTLVIRLKPKIEVPIIEDKDTTILADVPTDTTDFDEIVIDFNEDPGPVITTKDTTSLEFSPARYKAANIVLVLDISASMKRGGKLDLLKTSMLELVEMLRPIDKIGLVSFASNSKVISEPLLANKENKAKLVEIITSLEAGGLTNGAKGIKNGYKMTKSNKYADGNNTIILTTDGAFNQEGGPFYRTIRRGARKKITISVLGVKPDQSSENDLIALAAMGKGRYSSIQDYESALKVLKEELKKSSLKD